MRRILAALAAVVAFTPATADAATTGATSYCEHGRTASGRWTTWGTAAMNGVPFGTRITLTGRSFYGLRHFVVRDRIGHGSRLDLWAPSCSMSRRWGRRTVTYTLG